MLVCLVIFHADAKAKYGRVAIRMLHVIFDIFDKGGIADLFAANVRLNFFHRLHIEGKIGFFYSDERVGTAAVIKGRSIGVHGKSAVAERAKQGGIGRCLLRNILPGYCAGGQRIHAQPR